MTNLDLGNSKERMHMGEMEANLKLRSNFGKQSQGIFQASNHRPASLQGPANRFLNSFPSQCLSLLGLTYSSHTAVCV